MEGPNEGVLSNMIKTDDDMTAVSWNRPSRWAVGAAFGACGWAFLFAALSFYWALGGMAGVESAVSPAIAQLARVRVPWLIAVLWITGILKLGSGLTALALVQPWGRKIPLWILLLLAWGAGTLFAVHGGLFFVVGVLALSGALSVSTPGPVLYSYTFLWGPWFLLGGILFLVTAWIAVRRSPTRRVNLVFSLLGVFGALALLVLSGGTIG